MGEGMTKKQKYHTVRGRALEACRVARRMQKAAEVGLGYASTDWALRAQAAIKIALWARKEYYREDELQA